MIQTLKMKLHHEGAKEMLIELWSYHHSTEHEKKKSKSTVLIAQVCLLTNALTKVRIKIK